MDGARRVSDSLFDSRTAVTANGEKTKRLT